MLIIEIILTIFAWRKGWRWLALLPMGIALLIGLLIGFGIGASGGEVTSGGPAIVIDIMAVIALIVMVAKGPKSKETELPKNES